MKGILKGPEEFVGGVGKGIKSLTTNVVSGCEWTCGTLQFLGNRRNRRQMGGGMFGRRKRKPDGPETISPDSTPAKPMLTEEALAVRDTLDTSIAEEEVASLR